MRVLQTIQRVVFWVGAITIAAGTCFAQGPVGTWDLKMSFGDRDFNSKLTIAKDKDGALGGEWKSERGESKVSKVKFADGKLTFLRLVSFNDREMEMSFAGKITGDKLTGQISSDFGEMDVAGTRVVVAVSPLVGTWEVTMKSQRGDRKSTLVVNADLSGTNKSENSSRPIKNLKLDGKKVTYQMVIARQDREFSLDFAGTLDGNKMTGKYSIGERGAIADVTAVKVVPAANSKDKPKATDKPKAKPKAKPEAAMVGTWDITSTSDRGERKARLIVKKDLTAYYDTEAGEMKVTDLAVKDGKLTFTLIVAFNENEFALDFKGKLNGDSIEGVYVMEERGEVADVVGKKSK